MRLFTKESRLELRAELIRDPIERLRYLRLRNGAAVLPKPRARGQRGQWMWGAGFLVGLCLAVAAGHAFGGRGRTEQVLTPVLILPAAPASVLRPLKTGIWLVSSEGETEIYSNGLRVERKLESTNARRDAFRAFPAAQPDLAHAVWKNRPAGIVYHTTESNLAPFTEDENGTLQRNAAGVLGFVRQNHLYHYVIDRFGRVYRTVPEGDIAFHAGPSIWADEHWVYVNLNVSFLAVAFETQTQPGEDIPAATPAQIDAARVLTDMLRARYEIPAIDCVTHAQVSVNPASHVVGAHTDWADRFPFAELGLPDNYSQPPASLWAFGFDYDPTYMRKTGARLLPGLRLAELKLGASAARTKQQSVHYKTELQKNYQEIASAAQLAASAKEIPDEHQ